MMFDSIAINIQLQHNIEETIKMIDMWLSFKNLQPCPNSSDKTIAEVLSERKRQNIDV